MDLRYVKKLVKLLTESQIDEIEVEEDGKKVRVSRNRDHIARTHQAPATPSMQVTVPAPSGPEQLSADPTLSLEAPSAPPGVLYHEIKSPIVGTFYEAPAPDAAPFVEVGSIIQPGTVLCIVEAMKLMNEIESDVSGKIAKIIVKKGQPVEYGQTLFLVEKA
jgi:acetyl-CoA carboxylase biotin carboxyl carrier protein